MAGLDREKSLEVALAQIEKAYGKGAVMRLGDEVAVPMKVIPTGSIALDIALGVGGLPRGRVVEIYGPESSGKCLPADTYLWTDSGLETISELFRRCGQEASCTSRTTDVSHLGVRVVNERGELEQVSVLTHNNRRPVRRLRLASGRRVDTTYNHPLRVLNERGLIVWRRTGQLQVGDILVSAEFGAVEASGGDGLSEDLAVLLGYLVAEGSPGAKHAIRFTNQDPYVSAEFSGLMQGLFGSEVRLYNGQEHCVFDTTLRKRLADEFGLAYVNAPNKTVPACVRTGGHKIQRAFLSALFEGDGWIDPSSTVGFGTASEQLAHEVQLLLYGLGIPASVYRKLNKTYERHYWSVIVNPAVTHRFLDEVGFRSPRRAEQVRRCLRRARHDPQLENVPHLATLLTDLRDALGGSREFDRLAGDLFRADLDLACSRGRLTQLVAWFDRRTDALNSTCRAMVEHLRVLAEARYTYERIVDTEELGSQPTFDIVVPGTHSFIANGVLSHNTTVALHAVAQAQAAGGIAAFIDAEHALDPEYARALGVNTDALLVSQPDTGEQALEIMDMLIRSGALDIIVVDSVAALVPRAEIEGEMGDSHVGLQARLMSQALRKITGALSNSGTTAIFINQLREKIGVLFGSPETTTGGKALKFYASIRLDVRRIETLKDGGDAVGNRTRVKVVKNKVSPPFKQAEFDIVYGQGISREGSLIDVGVEQGIVRKSGAWYTYEGDQLGQGKENVRAFLRDNPDLADEIEKKLKEKLGIGPKLDTDSNTDAAAAGPGPSPVKVDF
ncbi:MAG: recombinase RecA [Geodermatophilaceae bacterium]|nr:recombinase RecA [Geodermatophilaceae bacterium]